MCEDDDSDNEHSAPYVSITNSRNHEDTMDYEDEMREESDTEDEDSDTSISHRNSRNSRSQLIRQRPGPGLDRRREGEAAAAMIRNSTTADTHLLERENSRLRQLIVDLQSTIVGDRQETCRLNQNLENLTGIVERLAGPVEQQAPDQSQLALRTKPYRAPRGGTLTVS